MRAAVPAALIGLLAILCAPASPPPAPQPTRQPAVPAVVDDPLAPNITRDLKLVAQLRSKRTVDDGTDPYIELTLVNISKTFNYPVVKPGDGSEAGWRDPHVFFTAEQRLPNGTWV